MSKPSSIGRNSLRIHWHQTTNELKLRDRSSCVVCGAFRHSRLPKGCKQNGSAMEREVLGMRTSGSSHDDNTTRRTKKKQGQEV